MKLMMCYLNILLLFLILFNFSLISTIKSRIKLQDKLAKQDHLLETGSEDEGDDSSTSTSSKSESSSSSSTSSSSSSTSNSSSTSTSSSSSTGEKKGKKPKEKERKKTDEEKYWELFYSKTRGENCKKEQILTKEMKKLGVDPVTGRAIDQSAMGNPFFWIKPWGFGQSAYLFDYLDAVFLDLMLKEFANIWKAFTSYKALLPDYKDPLDPYQKLDDSLDLKQKNFLKLKFDKLKEKIAKVDKNVYENSITAVKIKQGLLLNEWHTEKSVDHAVAFIREFDLNGDGRLSPRELLLGSIYGNKAVLGQDVCKNCYGDITDQIDAIFFYLDCGKRGHITSENIWTGLPKLKRMTNKTNFFTLADVATIRTAVTNDFILKNMESVSGALSKSEFRLGILLGFWDRQTDDYGIIKDDKRNLKYLRWEKDETVDKVALNYIKNQIKAQATKTEGKSDDDKINQEKIAAKNSPKF